MRCGGHNRSSTWPTVTHPKATSFSGRRWRSPIRRGLWPVIAWVVPDGATTCATAWPSARSADPLSYAAAVSFGYFGGIPNGVLRPDDSVVREIEDALRIAERSGDDLAVANVQMALGMALVHRDTAADRDRGQELLAEVGDIFVRRGHNLAELPIINVYLSRERARRGDGDDAIPLMRAAVDDLFREGRLLLWGIQLRRVFWWRRCWIVGPMVTWPKPRPRSTGWRRHQRTTDWQSVKSGCCGCARCWRGPAATTLPTETW